MKALFNPSDASRMKSMKFGPEWNAAFASMVLMTSSPAMPLSPIRSRKSRPNSNPGWRQLMSSHRVLRVRELLKREIGEAIRREIPVEQAGLVTVNDVEVAGDLRLATVFIGILGSAEQQRTGIALLHKN